MTNILHITASIAGTDSVSRGLSTRLVEKLRERTGVSVTERDLSASDLPYLDAERFAANGAAPAERTPRQQELAAIADQLIDELQQADTIVFGVPMYNFSMPATLKSWADLVARAGTTFKYDETGPVGLLAGRKAYIAVATGGTQVGGEMDFVTPWLKFFLGFLGITDVELVAADAIMGAGGEERIAEATAEAERLAA